MGMEETERGTEQGPLFFGKPPTPTPPPWALLGKADGRKSPVGHPSGRQRGPVLGGGRKFDH